MPSQSYDEDGWIYFFFWPSTLGLGQSGSVVSSDQLREAGRVKLKLERIRPLFITMWKRVHITRNRCQGSSMLYCLSMAWDELEWNFPVILLSYFRIEAVKKHSVEGD